VVCDRRDAGWWRRTKKGTQIGVRLTLATSLNCRQQKAIDAEVERLVAF
jgi:hypothetical protein